VAEILIVVFGIYSRQRKLARGVLTGKCNDYGIEHDLMKTVQDKSAETATVLHLMTNGAELVKAAVLSSVSSSVL
jgi:uncharacterized membrane protein